MTGTPRNPFHTLNARADDILAAYKSGGWAAGTELPFHGNNCYGCGPDNPAGLHFTARAGSEPGVITSTYTFVAHFAGAPGLVHGGAIAALVDDAFGYAMLQLLTLAVTRELAVKYRRPVKVGIPLEVRTWLVDRDERDLHLGLEFTQDGDVAVTGTAAFRQVELEHFTQHLD